MLKPRIVGIMLFSRLELQNFVAFGVAGNSNSNPDAVIGKFIAIGKGPAIKEPFSEVGSIDHHVRIKLFPLVVDQHSGLPMCGGSVAGVHGIVGRWKVSDSRAIGIGFKVELDNLKERWKMKIQKVSKRIDKVIPEHISFP